jgi:hypothetical protein
MRFMGGWTWYCEHHDSFGIGQTESEVQHLANAHISYYLKTGNPCRMYFKNQENPPAGTDPKKPSGSGPNKPQASTYMARVKENFARAWQKWDESEESQLKENFNARNDLEELTALHQRAAGGIVSRLKKLNLLDEEIDVLKASELLANKHEKLIKIKTFGGKLRVLEQGISQPRVDRGKESFSEFGMINPPPVPHPDLRHTSLFTCAFCNKPVVGNSCLCRGQ